MGNSELVETMLVIAEAGGFGKGGVNSDAKVRRNSTDTEDLFIAHIAGMDVFARSLIIAEKILTQSDYKKMRADRYSSFENGDGAAFESGKLGLVDLCKIAEKNGEPKQISGKQEKFEQLINMYI